MKRLLAIAAVFLAGCSPEPSDSVQNAAASVHEEGCIVDTSSNLVAVQKVSQITNLVKEEVEIGYRNICTVKFDIIVDGKLYHLEETESGLEQMASICYYARERARKELLLDLGGVFRSETNVVCRAKTD